MQGHSGGVGLVCGRTFGGVGPVKKGVGLANGDIRRGLGLVCGRESGWVGVFCGEGGLALFKKGVDSVWAMIFRVALVV